MSAVLRVRGLSVVSGDGSALVEGVDLDLDAGGVTALVGESGAGKTLTALALLGLVPAPARRSAGTIELDGADISALPEDAMRRLRGARIALVPQDPAAALDPVMRVGAQIAEVVRAHEGLGRAAARERAAAALAEVGVERDDHPHRLSGGQRQRALIAMALAMGPSVLIADEPTASLDARVQVGILDLLARRRASGLAVLLISHDIGAVARTADRVAVMRAGRIVEAGPAREVLGAPAHPYSAGLVAVAPRMGAPSAPVVRGSGAPLLEIDDLTHVFGGRRGRPPVRALDGVGLSVGEAQVVGLVGESGSGKSTLARTVVGLIPPTAGAITVAGVDALAASGAERARLRRTVQIVFQDPYLSLNPRLSVGASVAEPILVHEGREAATAARIGGLLEAVGLSSTLAARRPAELSGGERQRVAIARAVSLRPRLLVLDEPISALDPSIGAQILALLADLRAREGLAYLLISHDLATVRRVADEVAVMQAGRIVERGPAARVLSAPRSRYARALVEAAQVLSPPPWAWPGSTAQA